MNLGSFKILRIAFSPNLPFPKFACLSLLLPHSAIESLRCIALTFPTPSSLSISSTTPSRLFTQSYPLANVCWVSMTNPTLSISFTPSLINLNSVKFLPKLPPVPAVASTRSFSLPFTSSKTHCIPYEILSRLSSYESSF